MQKLVRRVLLGVAVGVAVYLGFSIWADARQVGAALRTFSWGALGWALVLALSNYLIRFLRWQMYLRRLSLDVPTVESFLVFIAGFSLTVTPGKVGEVLKSFLLRQTRGIPATRTAPIIVAERLTDLVGLLLLSAAGAFTLDVDRRFLVAAALVIVLGLVVVSVESLAMRFVRLGERLPVIRRMEGRLESFYRGTRDLLRPGPLFLGVALSTAAWWMECAAFFCIVRGFQGADLDLQPATFIYASMTIAGALSFLPGGLGVTEAEMLALLGRLATGVGRGTAAAATFLTRLCTLWFAVALGLCALLLFSRRNHINVDLPEAPKAPES